MYPGVVGKLGMEGGGHGLALAHDDRILPLCSEHFNLWPQTLNFWGADEYHLDWRAAEKTFTDGAFELPSVSVAADSDVECAESGLCRIFDFFGKKDRACAGAESWLYADKFFQLRESGFAEKFQECAGLAARDDETFDFIQLTGLLDEHNLSAQLFEPFAVSVEIALEGKDPDFHRAVSLQPSGLIVIRKSPLPSVAFAGKTIMLARLKPCPDTTSVCVLLVLWFAKPCRTRMSDPHGHGRFYQRVVLISS